jgi:predicted nuclease of restriction endonuclease-like (RecB) superfamily
MREPEVNWARFMSEPITATAEYSELLGSIERTIAAGRLRAARAVNNAIIETYWEIGRDIVARQREQGWGSRVIERLSADLRTANPGVRGLSVRNLQYMTSLASRWPSGIVQQSAAQLPWGHVVVLLNSCPDPETSEFYARRASQEGWTRAVLEAMIASQLHERSHPALTTFDQSIPEADRQAVREIVKDPFILEFLMADPVRERDLSRALTDNLSRFLRELGTGFAFVGAEVPVQCGDREFFLDLLFYHCRLHRYVVFELKLGRFEPEHVGKLNFYVQLVDDHLRDQVRDDATLGVLLVVGRDDVTVEVALRGIGTPIAVSEWRRLPTKVRQALPSAEDLSATVARTVREVESATPVALCGGRLTRDIRELLSKHVEICFKRVVAKSFWVGEKNLDGQQSGSRVVRHAALLVRTGPCRAGTVVDLQSRQVIPSG